MKSKRGIVVITATLAALASAVGVSVAAWSTTNNGAGVAQAKTMPTGNAPTASVTGRDVSVSWAANQISSGINVSGYLVKRYNGATAQTVNANCSGNLTGLTCTELAVSPGTYTYTVTPLQGDLSSANHWIGVEGTASASVVVGSPTFSGTTPTSVTSLPATITGSLSNFVDNQSLTFHLDSAGGTTLTGTPSSVSSTGTASVSVTLPVGTSNGNHTIYAVTTANGDSAASATVNVAVVGGIQWAGLTPDKSKTMSCDRSNLASIQCTISGVGNKGGFSSAQVQLLDPSGNPMNNPGSTISVSLSKDSGTFSPNPPSLAIASGASTTATSFAYATAAGNNPGTVTASVTVAGNTYTVNVKVTP